MLVATLSMSAFAAQAQQTFPPPPPMPLVRPMTNQLPTAAPNVPVHHRPPVISGAQPGQLADGILAWDSLAKECAVKAGDPEGRFTFNFTNISSGEVTITHVATSCGCTAAKLPAMPWKLAAGTNGEIPVVMSLAGKSGTIFKTVTVNTDKGSKMLTVKTVIEAPAPPSPGMTMGDDRAKNQELAKADRQAVFKGDCARCHVEPAKGKMGKELYVAACGVCHEAEHRATMVTDLHNLKITPNADYWKFFVVNGKPGTLMPAFAQSQGGPLTDEQIASLVNYLVNDFPVKTTSAVPLPPPTAH